MSVTTTFAETKIIQHSSINNISFNTNTNYNVSQIGSDFNFATAGDWSCNDEAKTTTDNILSINPEIVLALGDLSYGATGNCWLDIVQPLGDKMKIVLGNHDVGEGNPSSLSVQYETSYNLGKTFYSFNQGKVHFLILNSEIPFDKDSEQFYFINSDLSKSSSNSNIKWIIVAFHSPMYTSKSKHPSLTDLRDIYHPIFDKYGVDLVLQGHNHNYQRSFPLKFDSQNPASPIISDLNKNTYNDPDGEIYVIAGTAGRYLHPLKNQESFISNQFEGYGFLEIKFNKDFTKLNGVFHSNNNKKIIDEFSIQKNLELVKINGKQQITIFYE